MTHENDIEQEWRQEQEAMAYFERIADVARVCSYCGKISSVDYDFGIIDKDDQAHAFCSRACLIKWGKRDGSRPVKFWTEKHGWKQIGDFTNG